MQHFVGKTGQQHAHGTAEHVFSYILLADKAILYEEICKTDKSINALIVKRFLIVTQTGQSSPAKSQSKRPFLRGLSSNGAVSSACTTPSPAPLNQDLQQHY